jgi:tetratricopeptide (TPR) repeat protein
MARHRWDNLDFDPPSREPSNRSASQRVAESAGDVLLDRPLDHHAPAAPLALCVIQAQSAYALRNYPLAVELLEARLGQEPDLPGGQRVMGLALARLRRDDEAIARLQEAVQQSEGDWLARTALASLLLGVPEQAGLPSPVALLGDALGTAPSAQRASMRELLGAAYWRAGQAALAGRQDRKAAQEFARARREFAAAAAASGAARMEEPARQAAAFVGQAVALLHAGETEAAQRLFSSEWRPQTSAAGPLTRFAAGLYELCDALRLASPEERNQASDGLRQVVLDARLAVTFFDGQRAVSLTWLPGTT